MLFNSLTFCCFFIVVFGCYLSLRRHHHWQNALLLVASYVFYGWWDWRFLGLLWLSTAVDYSIGVAMGRLSGTQTQTQRRRKQLLTISIVVNLSVLAIFKYFDFFADGATEILNILGFRADGITLHILLPVGISFYTFQTMSYTIDIYRGKLKPTKKLADFALFVAFFPQLVAGPIERAVRLLPQIARPRTVTPERIWTGFYLLLWGYVEKVVVADNAGRIADEVFNNYENYQGMDILIGVTAFAFQILGDFSGYSNMARGLARMMGFDLMVNFRAPYLATSPADFWHRWHISLSSWLRDYLYIPLGGNRGGSLRTYRNLTITMLLGGLWHGAAWNFVIWGAYHGAGLAAHRAFTNWRGAPGGTSGNSIAVTAAKVAGMFAFTLGGWFLFRVTSLDQLLTMLMALGPGTSNSTGSLAQQLVFYASPLVVIQILQQWTGNLTPLHGKSPVATASSFAVMAGMIAVFGARVPMEFIYFQF